MTVFFDIPSWDIDPADCPVQHRGPQGPNEDLSQCSNCGQRHYRMRPLNEQIGLHARDCSLPQHHEGHCVGGGNGHPPLEVVRGYWPNMEADIAKERERFANIPAQGGAELELSANKHEELS